MAVGPETVVLLDAPTKDVIFAVPCSAVLGWSIQASRLAQVFSTVISYMLCVTPLVMFVIRRICIHAFVQ